MITSKQARDARRALRLSQIEVSRGTEIGRSYLSQFENGLRKLERSDLLSLRDFYEDKGYQFGGGELETALDESNDIQSELDKKSAKGEEIVSVSTVELSDLVGLVGEALLASSAPSEDGDLDTISNVIDGVLVRPELMQSESVRKLVADYLSADKAIKDHLNLDNNGKTESGFFGREKHGIKLVNAMALQYVRMMVLRDGVLMIPLEGFEDYKAEKINQGEDARAAADVLCDRLISYKPMFGDMFEKVTALEAA